MSAAHDRTSRTLDAASRDHADHLWRAASSAETAPPLFSATSDDPLSDVLQAIRLSGALFFMVEATSPWGVAVPHAGKFAPIILPRSRHVVSYHIVIDGEGWARIPGVEPTRFEAGDVLVFPHADPYAMLSVPDGSPELGEEESMLFFREMAAGKLPFVVEEGGGGPLHATYVCGFLGCDLQPFNPLLTALPRFMHVRRPGAGDMLDKLIGLTLKEASRSRQGGESVRLKLSELIFVEVLRRYLAALPDGQTGWFAGLRDPAVGRALTCLHAEPSRAWSLGELAGEANVSRTVLAARFTQLLGCPPMRYLRRWRMQRAARLLCDGSQKIAAVAHEAGYESEAAFSRAFKRFAGTAPTAWRLENGTTAS
ncbi:MAG: AraC family transcriptional regulator [Nitratireductor sp.]